MALASRIFVTYFFIFHRDTKQKSGAFLGPQKKGTKTALNILTTWRNNNNNGIISMTCITTFYGKMKFDNSRCILEISVQHVCKSHSLSWFLLYRKSKILFMSIVEILSGNKTFFPKSRILYLDC